MEREKTISKNFYNDEIKGVLEIDGRRVIYLKERVIRKRYYDWCDDTQLSQLNQQLIDLQRYEKYYKEVVGQDDFEND
jgi:hypothetical protein